MLKNAVSVLVHSFLDEVIDDVANQISILYDMDHVSVGNHQLLKLLFFQLIVVANLVDFAELADCFKEFIG